MELICFESGELEVRLSSTRVARYSRAQGNQLIMCARINAWERFLALWEKKTDVELWKAISDHCARLNSSERWKFKETFARLETSEEEVVDPGERIVKQTELP